MSSINSKQNYRNLKLLTVDKTRDPKLLATDKTMKSSWTNNDN